MEKFQTLTKVKKVVELKPPVPWPGSNYHQHVALFVSSSPLTFWSIFSHSQTLRYIICEYFTIDLNTQRFEFNMTTDSLSLLSKAIIIP